MLHQNSIDYLVIENLGMKKEKIIKTKLALEKIARDTGEDEDEFLFRLREEFKIVIEFEEIQELKRRNIWIWVTLPYSKHIMTFLENKLSEFNLSLLDYLKAFNSSKQKLIKYPEKVEICRVDKEVYEILREEHDLNSRYLTDYEWEKIHYTETWRKAQIQIAREFIAEKLLEKYAFKI